MMLNDIKAHLRKLDFPACVEEALRTLEDLCMRPSGPTYVQQHLLQEIQQEFIFSDPKSRKGLNPIKEVELLEVLALYCQRHKSEMIRNTVFLNLFHNTTNPASSKLLHKLVSIAVASQNAAVLNSSAILMQQLGCRSEVAVSLVKELVTDYFFIIPNTSVFLSELTTASPLFSTHFITATTCLYSSSGSENKPTPPPKLLELITNWVTNSPQFCLAPLTVDLTNSLPRGSIAMPAITPLPGLIRWCVEAPLCSEEENDLYSKLHLGVVEALQYAGKLRLQNVMMTRDFVQICDSVTTLLRQRGANISMRSNHLALDRLGQAIQVAVAINCLHGNKEEIYGCLKNIPENRLLNILVKTSLRM